MPDLLTSYAQSPAALDAQLRMTDSLIQARVRELGKWFHNLNLRGVQTAPDHFLGDYPSNKWQAFAHTIPGDLRGMTVLDIGCNAGFYSIEMKRRGAERVVAIDFDERYLAQARFAAKICEADIEFHLLSVYDLAELREKFDLVLFLGVFYHLRHPLLALDLIYEHVARDLLVFQSMQRGSDEPHHGADDHPFQQTQIFETPSFPRMYFIEKKYAGDPTNWWIPNRACTEAMLRSAGFDILDHPEEEVFICRKSRLERPSFAVYPASSPAS
jgi:tRNA (mo5U34)-methyltransferase